MLSRAARLALLAASFLALGGCSEPPETDANPDAPRPARIETVRAHAITDRHVLVGRIEANQSIDVAFEVGGRLAELAAREGETLTAGTLIARLEPTEFDLAVRQAEAELRLARLDLDRKRSLLASQGISQSAIDQAETLLELNEVRLAQAREAREDSELRAPFDGYVARRYLDNHVTIAPGAPVVRLNDLNTIRVSVSVPESIVATTTEETVASATARFDFLPGEQFELEYEENRGEADPVAQTYEVTFRLTTPDHVNLLPGMNTTVVLETIPPGRAALLPQIPLSALVARSAGADDFFVWVVDDDGVVHPRAVQVAGTRDASASISSGISEGERLVIAGARTLQSGMRVRPIEESPR